MRRPVCVSVMVSMVEPGILGWVGCKRENHAGQEGAEQRRAAAAVSCLRKTPGGMAAPVRQAHPYHPGQIREDVDRDHNSPHREADRVQLEQGSATVPDDDEGDPAPEQR